MQDGIAFALPRFVLACVLLASAWLAGCSTAIPTRGTPSPEPERAPRETPPPERERERAPADPLARRYAGGETLRFAMTGVNRSRESERTYTAECEGVVLRDAGGAFVEEFRWTSLRVGGREIALDEGSRSFRQRMSLDPSAEMAIPDISAVNPMLIGPILDLMTFYADLQPSLRRSGLEEVGDRAKVPHGEPNSWADGTHVLIGEDAIDFDLTLADLNDAQAVLRVRHVPPADPKTPIRMPAPWMLEPVGDAPNNWVQVARESSLRSSRLVAAVGMETFDVTITVERPSGRILSARMENPVEVRQRRCRDESLLDCEEPVRYRIDRQVELLARD